MCYTYIGLLSLTRYDSGYSNLQEMYHHFVRMWIWGIYLNKFMRVFTRKLHVWNSIIFRASASNATARAVQVLSGSTHASSPDRSCPTWVFVALLHVGISDSWRLCNSLYWCVCDRLHLFPTLYLLVEALNFPWYMSSLEPLQMHPILTT